jgi:hypothetical protein
LGKVIVATGFHYEDVPPQNWLDELQSFNVQGVWDIQLDNVQRSNLTTRAQDRLKDWRLALREQMKKIEGRYDSSNQDAKQRMLAPYQLLDNLGNDLNKQLKDLDERLKSGRAIPEGVDFGTRIFGDIATKRWYLGERPDEQRWAEFISVERRYMSLAKEYHAQSRGYENAKQRMQECKSDLAKLNALFKQRKGLTQNGVRLIIVITVVILCLLIGFVALFMEVSVGAAVAIEVLAAIMFIFAVIAAIIAFQLARRRRQSVGVIQADIIAMQQTLKQVQQEGKKQKQNLLPTRETFKEVRADYEALKASF